MENAATALAALPGIDVVVAGHGAPRLSCPTRPWRSHPDTVAGTLANKPAVCGGLRARIRMGRGWRIAGFQKCRARADCGRRRITRRLPPPCPRGSRASTPFPPPRSAFWNRGLSSYFSPIGDDPGLRLVTMAQRRHVRRSAARGAPAGASPIPVGGGAKLAPADGLAQITIPTTPRRACRRRNICRSLPVSRSHLRRSGFPATTSARMVRTLGQRFCGDSAEGQADQPPDRPGLSLLVISASSAVDWQIGLARPPRYAPDGPLANAGSRRIVALTHRGRPVDPAQEFILIHQQLSPVRIAASFRAGGLRAGAAGRNLARVSRRRYIAPAVLAPESGAGWRFALPDTSGPVREQPAATWIDRLCRPVKNRRAGLNRFLQLRLHL